MPNPTQMDGEKPIKPKVIWLQPWCGNCEKDCWGDGRLWCEDDAWGECDECGLPAVRYVLSEKSP